MKEKQRKRKAKLEQMSEDRLVKKVYMDEARGRLRKRWHAGQFHIIIEYLYVHSSSIYIINFTELGQITYIYVLCFVLWASYRLQRRQSHDDDDDDDDVRAHRMLHMHLF